MSQSSISAQERETQVPCKRGQLIQTATEKVEALDEKSGCTHV